MVIFDGAVREHRIYDFRIELSRRDVEALQNGLPLTACFYNSIGARVHITVEPQKEAK